jgi:hypothetical protein
MSGAQGLARRPSVLRSRARNNLYLPGEVLVTKHSCRRGMPSCSLVLR